MNEPINYEIVIRGRASERILGRLRDDFSIDPVEGGHTRLVGEIRDAAHLHGVITQLASLAIDIISLTPAEPNLREPHHPTPKGNHDHHHHPEPND